MNVFYRQARVEYLKYVYINLHVQRYCSDIDRLDACQLHTPFRVNP